MKKRIVLLAALFAANVNAADIEFGIGVTRNTVKSDGTWYQSPFPHDIDRNSASGSLGLRWTDDAWFYRAGYTYLGRWSSDALAVGNDNNFDPSSPTGCRGECLPLSRYEGHGDAQGLYAGVGHEWGDWSLEAGSIVYRSRWRANVDDWVGCEGCAPQAVRLKHKTSWQTSHYFGVGWRDVALQYIADVSADGDKLPAVYSGGAWRLEYRWRF